MANLDIIQELNDLGSSLANPPIKVPYSIPEGYFEGLAAHILELVKAMEAGHEFTSPLPKENPFQVPAGYFENFAGNVLNKIQGAVKEQTPAEELASLSPLLSSLSKEPVYSVPDGYFENFTVNVEEKQTAKVVSLSSRKWMRYAAAAVITGAIAVAGFFVIRNNQTTGGPERVFVKLEKDATKIDDVNQTQSMIEMMDAGLNEKSLAQTDVNIHSDDVQKLLQDISADELQDFTEQSKDIEDVMMTN